MGRVNECMQPKAWYREPWPWILMAGPLLVFAAGFTTVWLAIRSDDGVVASDYYKRGLAINEVSARAKRAEQLGILAHAKLDGDALRMRVVLAGPGTFPPELELTLVHPTRAVADELVLMRTVAPNLYEGSLRAAASSRRVVLLSDRGHTWRLGGVLSGNGSEVDLIPQ